MSRSAPILTDNARKVTERVFHLEARRAAGWEVRKDEICVLRKFDKIHTLDAISSSIQLRQIGKWLWCGLKKGNVWWNCRIYYQENMQYLSFSARWPFVSPENTTNKGNDRSPQIINSRYMQELCISGESLPSIIHAGPFSTRPFSDTPRRIWVDFANPISYRILCMDRIFVFAYGKYFTFP